MLFFRTSEIRAIARKREDARTKVKDFLESLNGLKRSLHAEMDNHPISMGTAHQGRKQPPPLHEPKARQRKKSSYSGVKVIKKEKISKKYFNPLYFSRTC